MTRPLPKPIAMLLVALVIVRVASVTWSATSRTRGDFYASMPGAYVETLNPDLWNSEDMTGAWGYHNHTYFHGPIQYLTLYPLGWFDTFAAIARVLLPLYLGILVLAFWMMWKSAQSLGAGAPVFVPLLASTFLFFPLLQAYLQREFEVVMTLALAGGMLALVRDRRSLASVLLAYVTWFKYIPLLFGCWLLLRRWWREAAVYAGVSAAILLVSHWLFDLSRFFNNNVPGHAAQVFVLWGHGWGRDATGHLYGTGFCEGWFDNESTLSNLRHGLCTMAAYNSWVNPPLVYLTICVSVAAVYLWTHFRLERMTLAPSIEARRRVIELSIITTICACFFFSHYYYLIVLVIPFNALLILYLIDRRYGALSLWAMSYFLVSAFVVPMTLMSRIAGFDVWEPYIWKGWFWYGEVLLVVLLMNEYRRLPELAGPSAR